MASLWQRTLCYGHPLSWWCVCVYYSSGRSFNVGGHGKDRCARKIWSKVGNVCGKIHINDNTRKCIRLHSVTLSLSKCLPFCTLQSKSKHSEHRRWWWTCTGECWLQWWCEANLMLTLERTQIYSIDVLLSLVAISATHWCWWFKIGLDQVQGRSSLLVNRVPCFSAFCLFKCSHKTVSPFNYSISERGEEDLQSTVGIRRKTRSCV